VYGSCKISALRCEVSFMWPISIYGRESTCCMVAAVFIVEDTVYGRH
jgi:hypothetical protein